MTGTSGARDGPSRSRLPPRRWPTPLSRPLAFPIARKCRGGGVRARLGARIGGGPEGPGRLGVGSRPPAALNAGHVRLMQPLADLVSFALNHERLHRVERERRRRTEVLEALLPTLAQVLDVRDVFRQVARIAQQVLPHDLLGLALFSDARRSVRVSAASHPEAATIPELPIPQAILPTIAWEFFIARELTIAPDRKTARARVYLADGTEDELTVQLNPVALQLFEQNGIRAQLRVPLRLRGQIVGALAFNSTPPDRYRLEDADVARRIADHVALALSHQRLGEKERRAPGAAHPAWEIPPLRRAPTR